MPWPWTVVLLLAVLLFALVAIFWRGDEALRKWILSLLDVIVPFVLGAGSGGGTGGLIIAARADASVLGGNGTYLTLQVGTVVACLLISIALMIMRSQPGEVREKLKGYISAVVPFLVGLATGAGVILLG